MSEIASLSGPLKPPKLSFGSYLAKLPWKFILVGVLLPLVDSGTDTKTGIDYIFSGHKNWGTAVLLLLLGLATYVTLFQLNSILLPLISFNKLQKC